MTSLLVGFKTSFPLMLIVGPIAILLVERGLTHGYGQSWPAPLAVAAVDTVYGALAAGAGAAANRVIGGRIGALETVAGLVLVALGAHMAVSMYRTHTRTSAAAVPASGDSASLSLAERPGVEARVGTTAEGSASGGTAAAGAEDHRAVARRFLAIVAVNPLTILAFISLALSAGRWLSPMWVVGVALASLIVHHGWMFVGHALGKTLSPRAILATRVLGVSVVIALGLSHLLK
jgi:threonine/homoserine/homoserine lactone efflux protein